LLAWLLKYSLNILKDIIKKNGILTSKKQTILASSCWVLGQCLSIRQGQRRICECVNIFLFLDQNFISCINKPGLPNPFLVYFYHLLIYQYLPIINDGLRGLPSSRVPSWMTQTGYQTYSIVCFRFFFITLLCITKCYWHHATDHNWVKLSNSNELQIVQATKKVCSPFCGNSVIDEKLINLKTSNEKTGKPPRALLKVA